MVWNGLTEPLLAPVLVNWPVTKGTFWPITILASSLSSVSRFGVDSMLPSPCVSMKSSQEAQHVDAVDLGRRRRSSAPTTARRCRLPAWVASVMMFWPPMVKLVPMHPDVLVALVAERALPLDAELGRLVGVHLGDQALDVDLRAARVQPVDDGAHLAILRLGGGDDQRVGRRIGLDLAAGRGLGRRLCRRRRRGGRRSRGSGLRGGLRRGAVGAPALAARRRARGRRRWPRASVTASLAASAFFR